MANLHPGYRTGPYAVHYRHVVTLIAEAGPAADAGLLADVLLAGWSHANYADDYGEDLGDGPEVPQRFESVATYYAGGWQEGIDGHQNGFNPDGTPMDS